MGLHGWEGAAEPNSALKPSSEVLLSGLQEKALCNVPPRAGHCSPLCFMGWEDLFSLCSRCGPCWAAVLLLEHVSSQGRYVAQRALRSRMCLCSSRALLVSGERSALQGFPAVLLPTWSYPWRHKNICPSVFVWKISILPFLFRSVSMKRNAYELSFCKPSEKEM